MKVTFCSYASPRLIDGPTAWLRRLLPLLREQGVEPRVLFIRRASGACAIIDTLRAQGFDCVDTLHLGYTEERIRWIVRRLADDPPDVFVPNMVIPAYYAARWVQAAGIPAIGVLHSNSDYYRAIIRQFVHGDEAQRLAGVLCVSEMLEHMVREQPVAGLRVARIPYGAPIPDTLARYTGGPLRLLYIGRLEEEQKRISDTTRALCRVAREVPGVEAFIYGDGSARPAVEQILQEEGVGLPVHFGGRVPYEQVQDLMLKAHVFVLLSDYEGVPVAMMEAMACGLVPVCMRIPSGVPELVTDGVEGILVDDRGDAFLSAIRALKTSPETWERMARAARAKVEAEYTIEGGAARWVQFLQEVQRTAVPRGALVVPRRITLPPPEPVLARLDRRSPPLARRLTRQAWKSVRALKRSLVGPGRSLEA